MKKFIFSIMAAALLLTVSAPKASAQNFNFDPAQMAQMRVDQMKESIKLNSEQAEKLLTIFKKQSEEMSKMFEGGGMPDMNKMQENMKKQDLSTGYHSLNLKYQEKKYLTDLRFRTNSKIFARALMTIWCLKILLSTSEINLS